MLSRGLAGFLVAIAALTATPRATPDDTSGGVTFNRDVLPILQKNCQTCHRPGEIAPMPFLTYKDVRPWAKAIKTAVVSRQMPPCLAVASPLQVHLGQDRLGHLGRLGRKLAKAGESETASAPATASISLRSRRKES